jgi:hypothetical protein
MLHWMLNCKEVSEKMSESMDRKLPLFYRMQLKMHFLMCKYCKRFKDQMILIRGAVRFDGPTDDDADPSQCLSKEAYQRIKQAMINHMPKSS